MNIVSKSKNKYLENEKRHQLILKVAFKSFNAKGYKGTTTAEIASGAKINEPTLYKHFGSKKELFLECFNVIINQLMGIYKTVYNEYKEDELNYIIGVIRAYLEFVNNNPDKSKFLVQLLSYREEPEFGKVFDDFFLKSIVAIEKIITSARKKGLLKTSIDDHFLAAFFVSQYFSAIALHEIPLKKKINIENFIQIIMSQFGK